MGIEIGALALGASILSGAIGAGAAVQSGMAANAAAQYKAKVGDNFATQSRLIGQVDAQKQGMKTSAILGAQTAGQSASGLDLGSGSAVDVRATTASLGKLDELTILNNAENKARSYTDQAALDRMSGSQSQLEGWLKGSSSILGAVGSVGDKWASFKTKGVPIGSFDMGILGRFKV